MSRPPYSHNSLLWSRFKKNSPAGRGLGGGVNVNGCGGPAVPHRGSQELALSSLTLGRFLDLDPISNSWIKIWKFFTRPYTYFRTPVTSRLRPLRRPLYCTVSRYLEGYKAKTHRIWTGAVCERTGIPRVRVSRCRIAPASCLKNCNDSARRRRQPRTVPLSSYALVSQ